MNFTFNLLERFSVLRKIYPAVANSVNKNLLSRDLFDPELIADTFDALDSFWLKHGKSDWYSRSEIRVIIGVVLESLRDNNLSAKEVKKLVNYFTAEWKPEIARAKKIKKPLTEALEKQAMDVVNQYKVSGGKIKPEKFVKKVLKKLK